MPSSSLRCRSSFAALSLAAMASPGSWNVGFVGALVDLGGGGGVGKDMDIGRGLEWGMFAGSWVARGAMLCRVVEVLTEVVRLRLELVVDSRGGGGAMELRTEDWRLAVDCRTDGLWASFLISMGAFLACGEAVDLDFSCSNGVGLTEGCCSRGGSIAPSAAV